MVQMADLTQIAEAWRAQGSPVHEPRIDKEFHLGSATGDVGCLECGDSWNPKTGGHPPQAGTAAGV